MVVTEGWPPNVERAGRLLAPRGVTVVPVGQGQPLPLPDAGFELVTSRHPVNPDWPEIARVLADRGTYLAQHGLDIVDLRTARCRMEFFDVGAVVHILRKCVWWVPDFSVERYRDTLERLDAHIRRHGTFVAHSTRTLVGARRVPR